MDAGDPGEGRVRCRSYTYARRYPLVIGKIGGWSPPWGPWTLSQYGAAVAVLVALMATRGLWGQWLGVANLVVLLGVPLAVGWMLRRDTLEGRRPHRALAGMAAVRLAPAAGMVAGRPYRPPRPQRLRGAGAAVADLAGRQGGG